MALAEQADASYAFVFGLPMYPYQGLADGEVPSLGLGIEQIDSFNQTPVSDIVFDYGVFPYQMLADGDLPTPNFKPWWIGRHNAAIRGGHPDEL